ncbi:MAG TPA: hypothetical protein VGY75_05200 [Candidatus Udaeobacter sp.]|nr:hypothetical protein [Candidatus Udaeobacter sp.]
MILSPRLLLRANPQVIPLRQARHIARAREGVTMSQIDLTLVEGPGFFPNSFPKTAI